MRSTIPSALLAAAAALAVTAAAPAARADASAWMSFGFGALGVKPGTGMMNTGSAMPPNTFLSVGTMTIEAGAGTSPDGPVILGGLFRIQPLFGNPTLGGGADLATMFRFATHGFQAGDFGLAVDAGGYARFWGIWSGGFAGTINLGLPLGFTISAQTEVGTHGALAFGGVAGIDLLRLTVYRQTLLKWWDNPSPAWKVPPKTGP